jgi:hypothetical protein
MVPTRYRIKLSSTAGIGSVAQSIFESCLRTRDEITHFCGQYCVTAVAYGPVPQDDAIAVIASNGHWVDLLHEA